MKQLLKRAARSLAAKPYIGPVVRFGIAIVRFPTLVHRHNVFVNQQLPQLLDTISEIQHRQARLDGDEQNFLRTAPATLRQLTLELAHVRRELKAAGLERGIDTAPLASAVGRWEGAPLRVNLGCGSTPKHDYVNVDTRPFPGVDVTTRLDQLPFQQESVHEFFSSHLLERFAPDFLRRTLLPHFFRLLAAKGHFHAVVSDMDAVIQNYAEGARTGDELRDAIFGVPIDGHDSRRNIFTAQSLSALLEGAGFVNVRVLAQGRQNGKDYELEIVAEKGAAKL